MTARSITIATIAIMNIVLIGAMAMMVVRNMAVGNPTNAIISTPL